MAAREIKETEADAEFSLAIIETIIETITVKTWFHVVYENETEAGGFIPEKQLEDQFAKLNVDYNPHGISFELEGTTKTENQWGNDQTAMKAALRRGDYSTLNVYFLNFENFLGLCTFPDTVEENSLEFLDDGCLVLFSTLPGAVGPPGPNSFEFTEGEVATHEVGHWFGLFHTFTGGVCDPENDMVDDTPVADFNPCGLDTTDNFMSYHFNSCWTRFTPGQKTRMHNMWNAYRAGRQ